MINILKKRISIYTTVTIYNSFINPMIMNGIKVTIRLNRLVVVFNTSILLCKNACLEIALIKLDSSLLKNSMSLM